MSRRKGAGTGRFSPMGWVRAVLCPHHRVLPEAPATDIYEDAARQIASIQEEFDKTPDRYIGDTEMLSDADLTLVGTVVQLYGFTDLHARLIIDHIRHAALGPDQRNGSVIQDAQVYEKLIEAAELLPDGNTREGLIRAANTLSMHVMHRHHLAHWATRRVKGQDVFVMFTYNSKETKKRLGHPAEPEHLTYALLSLPPLRAELNKLQGHGRYLAAEAGRLQVNFNALKAHFDAHKEAERAAKFQAGKWKKRGRGGPKTR
jgi:hypothetical protein